MSNRHLSVELIITNNCIQNGAIFSFGNIFWQALVFHWSCLSFPIPLIHLRNYRSFSVCVNSWKDKLYFSDIYLYYHTGFREVAPQPPRSTLKLARSKPGVLLTIKLVAAISGLSVLLTSIWSSIRYDLPETWICRRALASLQKLPNKCLPSGRQAAWHAGSLA